MTDCYMFPVIERLMVSRVSLTLMQTFWAGIEQVIWPSTSASTFLMIIEEQAYLLWLRHQTSLCNNFLKYFMSYYFKRWKGIQYFFYTCHNGVFFYQRKNKSLQINIFSMHVLMHPLLRQGYRRCHGTVNYSMWQMIDCAL